MTAPQTADGSNQAKCSWSPILQSAGLVGRATNMNECYQYISTSLGTSYTEIMAGQADTCSVKLASPCFCANVSPTPDVLPSSDI